MSAQQIKILLGWFPASLAQFLCPVLLQILAQAFVLPQWIHYMIFCHYLWLWGNGMPLGTKYDIFPLIPATTTVTLRHRLAASASPTHCCATPNLRTLFQLSSSGQDDEEEG